MQPWKMFIRSVSVVTVLTAGGFAAGQAVVPFANASRGVSPNVEEAAPEADPVVDPAEEAAESDDSTTTTTGPDAPATDDAPSTDAPSTDPVVDPVPAPEVPEESTTTTADGILDVNVAPPAPAAAPAPKAKKDPKAKKVKGDHNCDGHLDNGWHNKRAKYPNYPETNSACAEKASPAPAPAPAAAPASADDANGRSEDAKQDGPNGRSEDAKQDGSNGRSASAPGQMKKSV